MLLEIKVPSPGESITEVEIGSWLKKDGQYVELDEELAEINSDKATLTANAPASGILKITVASGVVKVGEVIGTIDASVAKPSGDGGKTVAEQKTTPQPEVVTTVVSNSQNAHYAKGHTSPSAENLIQEKNLDKNQISGTGKDGRITKGDVLNTIAKPQEQKQPLTQSAPVVTAHDNRQERREKMTTLRRKIAQRLVSVKNETAMLTTFNEVDMSGIMEIRKKYKDKFKEVHGVGLGFMSFFTKACCEALRMFPAVNASIDGEEVVYHDYCDIGVAVSTERGLVVPILRNAERLSLAQIEAGIGNLAAKGRDGKLSIDDMTGGTFTITNGGVFGSMLSTPIINPPQSAILGMHNIVERPVAVNGQVVIRPIMYVALSYDHRIIDGKESVSFLFKVKELLEDPNRLLLGF